METFTIDAQGKSLGRVASEAAKLLMAKHHTAFVRNVVPNVSVKITNAKGVKVSGKKLTDKAYRSYSGFAGGFRKVTLQRTIETKGHGEIIRKAVYGMLPVNSLRSRMIKHLTIEA